MAVLAELRYLVRYRRTWCLMSTTSKLKTPFLRVYRLHVYYTTRRLFVQLRVALPGDTAHSWYQNDYDDRAFKSLCDFGVPPTTDWRQKLNYGCQGFGSYSQYMEPSGTYRQAQCASGPFFHPIDTIRHNRDISRAWTTFILDKGQGFTQVVWCG